MTKKKLILPMLGLCLVACGVSNGPTSNESNLSNTPTSETPSKELDEKNLFLVGDSTVSSFNDAYYYPRYGYGTQIGNYFDSKLKVNNLALSGRSSKSFLSESNYETFKASIKEGDYLIIGFGHNDEKDDDALRFTNPTGGVDDETSFKHYLYNY